MVSIGYGWWLSTAIQKLSVVPMASGLTEWLGLRQAKYPAADPRPSGPGFEAHEI
jgi:hypothetical protein